MAKKKPTPTPAQQKIAELVAKAKDIAKAKTEYIHPPCATCEKTSTQDCNCSHSYCDECASCFGEDHTGERDCPWCRKEVVGCHHCGEILFQSATDWFPCPGCRYVYCLKCLREARDRHING